jgi:diguanylate cyclase (GGDEF)-like protein/PAS domain S-box-containing protein
MANKKASSPFNIVGEAKLIFDEILEAMTDGAIVVNRQGLILMANTEAQRMFGYERDELLGVAIEKLVPEAVRPEHGANCADYFADPRRRRLAIDHSGVSGRRRDGGRFPAEICLAPIKVRRELLIVSIVRDVTGVRETERTIVAERGFRQAIEASMPAGVAVVDPEGRLTYVNQSFSDMVGWAPRELIGAKAPFVFWPEEELKAINEALDKTVRGKAPPGGFELKFKRRDGERFYVLVMIAALKENGVEKITGWLASIQDITEIKRTEQKIGRLAYYDSLTGLPNRRLLVERLEQALAFAQRNDRKLAVLYLDLDHFKRVNDTLGHDVGDLLLRAIGQRVQSSLRRSDTVGRVGGDEFTVVLGDVHDATAAAHKVQAILEKISKPLRLRGHQVFPSACIGISLFPEDGDSGETLLKNADMALLDARKKGRNRYQFYAGRMQIQAMEQVALENDLRDALERGQFAVFYQPYVDVGTGRILGVEALLRWRHPKRGMLDAEDFLPVAEETGLILRIGQWALQAACRQSKAWQLAGFADLRLAVNLSTRELGEPGLADRLADILQETGLKPEILQVEVTEQALQPPALEVIENMSKLKGMGLGLAIDHFGTFSSIQALTVLSTDLAALKLAPFFVGHLANPAGVAVAEGIISTARALQLQTIAEGVETDEQLEILRSLRCDAVQGFVIAPAVSAEAFTDLLATGFKL